MSSGASHDRAPRWLPPPVPPLVLLPLALLVFGTAIASAEETPAVDLDARLASLEILDREIRTLEERAASSEGIERRVLEARLDRASARRIDSSLDLAEIVADQEEATEGLSPYRKPAVARLAALPPAFEAANRRLRASFGFPDPESPAPEHAAAGARLGTGVASLNRLDAGTFRALELSRRFGLDVSKQEAAFRDTIAERAIQVSILLDLTVGDVEAFAIQTQMLPEDADLKAMLAIAEHRRELVSEALEHLVSAMESLELDASAYQQQLLEVTGEVSTSTLDLEVLRGLVSGWGDSVWRSVAEGGPRLLLQLVILAAILVVAFKVAQLTERLVEKGIDSAKLQLSELVRRMVVSGARNLVFMIGLLIGLSQLGLSLGPLLAGLGIAGFVIGFALQDTLSNFASGLMILLYRPFDVGDLVEAGTVFGNVSHMSLVNTTILTLDNQRMIVPNNKIWGDVIKNLTAEGIRRVDMVFGISYGDFIPKAETILQDIVEKHERVLADPPPNIRVHELGDSSVNFVVRPWAKVEDYWDVFWDVTRSVKMRFDEEGVTIPFPQRDVHFPSRDVSAPPAGRGSEGPPPPGEDPPQVDAD